MKTFNYKTVEPQIPKEDTAGVKIHWVIDDKIGADKFSMRVFEIDPKGYTPFHTHPWEHEVFIISGKGRVRSGDEWRDFGPDDVIFIPAGEHHQFENTGNEMIKMICCIPSERLCNL